MSRVTGRTHDARGMDRCPTRTGARAALVLLSLVGCCASFAQERSEKPSALLAFETARQSLCGGRVQWRVLPGGDDERALRYVSRFAQNGDMICEYRGDKDGWVAFDPETHRGTHRFPQLYLQNSDGMWYFQETGVSASWWKNPRRSLGMPGERVKDIRAVGAFPTSLSLSWLTGFSAVWNPPPNHEVVAWTQRQAGDHHIVTAQCATGAKLTWYINPAKDWNAERVLFELEATTLEAACSLKQYGGVWLPEETRYLQDGRLVESIRIDQAVFSPSGEPARFTLADLGAEPGTHVGTQDEPMAGGRPLIWNGEDVCSREKWDEDRKTGKRRWGPSFRRMFEQNEPYSSPYETEEQRRQRELSRRKLAIQVGVRQHEVLWVKYVEAFIQRYQLGDEQAQKAWQVLRVCQTSARQYLERRARDFYDLEQQLEKDRQHTAADELKRLNNRLSALRKPIDDIFEKQLKARLEKLPTSTQRRAAEEREKPTSKPAKAGGGQP